jgi:hypothetical protein
VSARIWWLIAWVLFGFVISLALGTYVGIGAQLAWISIAWGVSFWLGRRITQAVMERHDERSGNG